MAKKETKTVTKTTKKETALNTTVKAEKQTKTVAANVKEVTSKKEPVKKAKKTTVKKESAKEALKQTPTSEALSSEKENKVVKAEPKKSVSAKKEATSKATTKTAKKATPAKKQSAKTKAIKETKTAEETKTDTLTKATPMKKEVKKTAPKKTKTAEYEALSLSDCIAKMQTMQINYAYEDYYQMLLNEADLTKLSKTITKEFDISKQDSDLIAITLQKVADTMEIKAADFKDLKKAIDKAMKFQANDDEERSAAAYLEEFRLAEKLLMIAQRKQIDDSKTESDLLGVDVSAFYKHFFDFAYNILPTWQYSDVKFYEDFAYAVLSQFNDLYQEQEMRIQIDVADLYIKHGDYAHGDEMYGYILRDNQIKDYIYYRYAHVYQDIDYNKAKAIAYSSRQYVDERYTYYPDITAIIEKQ